MPTPNESLVETLLAHKDELIDTVCYELQKLSRTHYETIDFEKHQQRVTVAFTALINTLKQKANTSFLQYIEGLAGKRSDEGYSIAEVQNAVRIFEEGVWNLLIIYCPANSTLIKMLFHCNRIFGEAKDHLARIYLEKSTRVQKELDELREKFYVYRHEKKDHSADEDHY